jgi:DNA-binding XRE family transcriptional regulator
MNKPETTAAKKEIRTLKSELNHRQKELARALKTRRCAIRNHEKDIAVMERDSSRFLAATTKRLAVLEGRLNS